MINLRSINSKVKLDRKKQHILLSHLNAFRLNLVYVKPDPLHEQIYIQLYMHATANQHI